MSERVDVLSVLRRSYLFEDLTTDDLRPLAAIAVVRRLVPREVLWPIGAPADEICVAATGEVKATVVNLDGDEVIHSVYGPGMTFGEPGFFAIDHVRIVETLAVQHSAVVVLHRRELVPFMRRHGEVKDRALEALASLVSSGSVRREGGRYVLVDEAALREQATRDWPMSNRRDRRIDLENP